ncbi:hypothetical protein LCGC14_2607180 [marine sediment metagenome]|uniref:Uncharacterized protein n=1 Tax=marine sediment metagenome TaxID=412755 RepID=A0A0F9CZR2_9ZZZZ
MEMTMISYDRKVGQIIRIEWDKETGDVRVVMDITDPAFKSHILHNKDFQDILTIRGKDVIVVASKMERD